MSKLTHTRTHAFIHTDAHAYRQTGMHKRPRTNTRAHEHTNTHKYVQLWDAVNCKISILINSKSDFCAGKRKRKYSGGNKANKTRDSTKEKKGIITSSWNRKNRNSKESPKTIKLGSEFLKKDGTNSLVNDKISKRLTGSPGFREGSLLAWRPS